MLTSLSPSAYNLWYSNRDEFYMKYLSPNRIPKIPQSKPMSVGAAFDVEVKAAISAELGIEMDREAAFAKQVEEHNSEWAAVAGRACWEAYKKCGAYAEILTEIEGTPRMEDRIKGNVKGVPLQGIPDLLFRTKGGGHVVLDWKVNGYCSKSGVSPEKGYIKIRDTEFSNKHGTAHPDAVIASVKGISVNVATTLDILNREWAVQLAIYAWILGEPIGGDFIVGIDQLVCRPPGPRIRVAKHRLLLDSGFQNHLADDLVNVWTRICDGNIFDNITDQAAHRETLDLVAASYGKGESEQDKWFDSLRQI